MFKVGIYREKWKTAVLLLVRPGVGILLTGGVEKDIGKYAEDWEEDITKEIGINDSKKMELDLDKNKREEFIELIELNNSIHYNEKMLMLEYLSGKSITFKLIQGILSNEAGEVIRLKDISRYRVMENRNPFNAVLEVSLNGEVIKIRIDTFHANLEKFKEDYTAA